ncbi:MAG: dihydrolipoamide acetyltransferase family protein [Candidatus Thorarchaeota archaeon]
MVYELKFADIGEGIHEGEILEWHVQVGDYVEEEQLLVEVMTEKVNVEITAPVAGTIQSLGKEAGGIINVGEVLVTIDTGDATATAKAVGTSDQPSVREEVSPAIEEKDDSLFTPSAPFKRIDPQRRQKPSKAQKPLAAPAVRRLAREQGINLAEVPGSGPAGRITRADIDGFLSRNPARIPVPAREFPSGGEERIPLRGIRRAISQAMRRSKDTAAHFTYFDEVDMSALNDLRHAAKPLAEKYGVKLTYLPLIIKCLIPALKEFPYFNSSLDDDNGEIILKHYYNIGIAVDTEQGLVVPVVKNADQKSVWELAADIADLAQRAREGKLKLDDMREGTFTLTNVGPIGGMMATPIINWPEVAILGTTKIKLRPVVVEKDGKPEVGIRPMMYLSLSFDHRVVDGAVAARFVNTLIRYMENPTLLLLEDGGF